MSEFNFLWQFNSSAPKFQTGIYVLVFKGCDLDIYQMVAFENESLAREMMDTLNQIVLKLPVLIPSCDASELETQRQEMDQIVRSFPRPAWISLEVLVEMLTNMHYREKRWSESDAITLTVEEFVLPVFRKN
jgi:hypothetical protein